MESSVAGTSLCRAASFGIHRAAKLRGVDLRGFQGVIADDLICFVRDHKQCGDVGGLMFARGELQIIVDSADAGAEPDALMARRVKRLNAL